jgi:hypothetical protein
MKMSKTVIALVFMFLMVASTFAFTALQSFKGAGPSSSASLPSTNVINYELTAAQENTAITSGYTLAKFYHYSACSDCAFKMSFLEYMAKQYPTQIFLEEIETNRTTSLIMTSYIGQKTFANATQDQMLNAFCSLMSNPPAVCAIK